jgi:hypothetical protein
MSSNEFFTNMLMVSASLLVLFLLFREVICWYWKINRHITLLTEIRDLLRAQNQGNPVTATTVAHGLTLRHAPAMTASAETGTCSHCTGEVPTNAITCPHCQVSFAASSTWRVLPR